VFSFSSPFPGLFLLDCVRFFAFDCSSRVRSHQHPRDTPISPNQPLIDISSIAIWNRNKAAMAATIGVWGINIVFLIQGKSLLPLLAGNLKPYTNILWYQVPRG
jgi:hypothetical protein